MKITTTKLISSLLHSVFVRRSKSSIYSMGENLREPSLLAQNLRSNGPDFAVDPSQFAALLWPLANNFLMEISYKVVSHVDYLDSPIGARISLDLDLNLALS